MKDGGDQGSNARSILDCLDASIINIKVKEILKQLNINI